VDQRIVLDALLQDVVAVVAAHGLVVDAILVTGDVAFSGGRRPLDDGREEYFVARLWFERLRESLIHLGLAPEVMAVPGNHDVDRKVGANKILDHRAIPTSNLDDALAAASFRNAVARRFSSYSTWQADVCAVAGGDTPGHWERLVHQAFEIRIVGLNTSLLCADEHDRGQLELGRSQAESLLTSTHKPSFTVVMGHHPVVGGWLVDESFALAALGKSADLYLHGHLHLPGSEMVTGPGRDHLVTIAAGPTHAPRSEPPDHAYSLISLECGAGGRRHMVVRPRRWIPAKLSFETDPAITGRHSETMVYELPPLARGKQRSVRLLEHAGSFLERGSVDDALHVISQGRDVAALPPERRFEWLLINQKFGRLHGLVTWIEEWLDADPGEPLRARLELLRLKVESQLHQFDTVVAHTEQIAEALAASDQRHLVLEQA
jgi:predicted phosphodiesterase